MFDLKLSCLIHDYPFELILTLTLPHICPDGVPFSDTARPELGRVFDCCVITTLLV